MSPSLEFVGAAPKISARAEGAQKDLSGRGDTVDLNTQREYR
jgi:hypothetical protein